MGRILIVDDDPDICVMLSKFLDKKGFETRTAKDGTSAIKKLKKEPADLVLCDFKLPDYNGIEILQKIKVLNPATQVIIITGYSDVRSAVDALKKGAYDYVTKPLYPDEILHTIEKSLADESQPTERQNKKKSSSAGRKSREYVKGVSPQSETVQKHIALIAPTDMSVIIQGETGTGKEFVASAIHTQSKRSSKPFVAVDCGALPENLAGSELFGHVKGAYTGAIMDKKGCFELANGGTLFLDEISNLSYENQIKLLRVLQERKIKRVGGTKDIPVDVRLLIASNEDLWSEVKQGNFREDVFHRLNEFKIDLAPLRDRPDDIELFAKHFLSLSNKELGKEIDAIAPDAMSSLRSYYWHGNLRELHNVIKRSVLLCEKPEITAGDLPQEISGRMAEKDDESQVILNNMHGSLKEVSEEAEKKAILRMLEITNNNKTRTAELLKVDRKTLYNKIKIYGIDLK